MTSTLLKMVAASPPGRPSDPMRAALFALLELTKPRPEITIEYRTYPRGECEDRLLIRCWPQNHEPSRERYVFVEYTDATVAIYNPSRLMFDRDSMEIELADPELPEKIWTYILQMANLL